MLRTTILGSPYVGVYTATTDGVTLVGATADADTPGMLAEEFETTALATTVGGATTVGALATGNERGLVVSGRLTDEERVAIEREGDVAVTAVPGRMNALGNCLLVNDYGGVAHPDLSDGVIDAVGSALSITVERVALGGVKTVGTAAVATNRGVLCHPKIADEELDHLEAILDVRADVGTVNYGSPLIGSGLVANGDGYVVGQETTGPELGRIEESLGFLE